MAEEIQLDSVEFQWESNARLVEPGAGSFYGDHFPEGPRYRFKITKVTATQNKETKKIRISLEATCVDGQGAAANCIGRTLKNSFNMPLPSEATDEKKQFGARLFHSTVVAAGHKQMPDGAKVPLSQLVGDEFEATTRDYSTKEVVKIDADGNEKKYPAKLTSQIKDVFGVGGTASVLNAPLNKEPASTDFDFK